MSQPSIPAAKTHPPASPAENKSWSIFRQKKIRELKQRTGSTKSVDEKELESAHKFYGRTLRNWLILYGISVPALLASSEALSRFLESPAVWSAMPFFFVGILIQLLMTWLWKTCLWHLTVIERKNAEDDSTFWERASFQLSDHYWLEVLSDGLTIGSYLWGTWMLANAVINSSTSVPVK